MFAALAGDDEFYLGESINMVPKYTSAWPVLWLQLHAESTDEHVFVPYTGNPCSKYMWADTYIASINEDTFSRGRSSDGVPTWDFPTHTVQTLMHLVKNANTDYDSVASDRSDNGIDQLISVEVFQFAVENVKSLWKKVSVSHPLNSPQKNHQRLYM